MQKTHIPMLADLLDAYHDFDEVVDMARILGVEFEDEGHALGRQAWLSIARQLIEQLDHGSRRALLGTLLDQLEVRNACAIAVNTWERRTANEELRPHIARLRAAFETSGTPAEIVVADGKEFTAKSEIREFLASASTEVFVVDPYVGVGTLDCLRALAVPVRLLTGASPQSVENGFDAALRAFRGEGFRIDARRHTKLHDRHLVFNDRCWLVGSSLKDAGKKAFHAMEITDAKQDVIASLESKWVAGTPYA